jgi:tetratricopeptide (TPR) repeat protein
MFVFEQTGCPDKFKKFLESKSAGSDRVNMDQSHIFEQYTNVLNAIARKKPLILVLDDLQWADSASISLLFHLGRRIETSRILVLGAFRPEEVKLGRGGERHPLEKVLAEFKRYFGDVWVDLDQAEVDESRLFIDALVDLEPNHLGEGFRQELARHTGGHPLFTVELLRNMHDQGDLKMDGDGCWVEGPALDWDALPPRVEGVIEERLGRLDADGRDTLNVGSVEGEQFTAEVIARVRAVDERSLVQTLSNALHQKHSLVVSQGVRRLGAQPLSAYRFRHNLFQKYIYDNLDAPQKTYLHEDVGRALEGLYQEQAAEVAPQLSRHFEKAGLVEKAIHYLAIAGEQARYRYANTEAIEYFRRAMALMAESPPNAPWRKVETELHETLGDLLMFTGRVEDAKAAYLDILSKASPGDPVWRSRLHRKIGNTWGRLRYYHQEALHAFDLAEAALGQEAGNGSVDSWQEWIAIQIDRIRTLYWSKGHWTKMQALAEKTRLAVQKYGSPAQLSNYYTCLVYVDNRRYCYIVPDETLTYAGAALVASEKSGDLSLVAGSQFLIGFCHLWRGELDKARESIQAALSLAERIGDVDDRLLCLAFLPVIYRKSGQLEEARALLPRRIC